MKATSYFEILKAVWYLIFGFAIAFFLNVLIYLLFGMPILQSPLFYIGAAVFSYFYFFIQLRLAFKGSILEYIKKRYPLEEVIVRLWVFFFVVPTTFLVKSGLRWETFQLILVCQLVEIALIRWKLSLQKRISFS